MTEQNKEYILKEIYKFESDENLLKYTFSDVEISYWMYIRQRIIRKTEDDNLNITETVQKKPYIEQHRIEENIRRNPFFSASRDILFAFFDNAVFSKNEEGVIAEQRMYPYMELFRENTTVLVSYQYEDKFEFQCSYPHWRSDRFLMKCIGRRLQTVQKKKKGKKSTKNIKRFIQYLEDKYPYQIDFQTKKQIFEELKFIMEFQPVAVKVFEKYLSIVKPKIVIINCASYFPYWEIAMTIACKKRNIITAEIQHGMIGKWSEAYHCGNAIKKNEFCKLIYPDYYLTRGAYWNQMIDIPTTTYVIGNAKLSDVKKTVNSNNILFVAETEIDFYIDILDYILEHIEKDIILYFRLHPYRYNEEVLYKFRKYDGYDNFVLANDRELGYYLNQCRFVISSYSMVTYEALSVGRIVLFLKENGYKKIYEEVQNMVYDFSDGREFMELWNRKEELEAVVYSSIFENDWEKRYRGFLKKVGVLE